MEPPVFFLPFPPLDKLVDIVYSNFPCSLRDSPPVYFSSFAPAPGEAEGVVLLVISGLSTLPFARPSRKSGSLSFSAFFSVVSGEPTGTVEAKERPMATAGVLFEGSGPVGGGPGVCPVELVVCRLFRSKGGSVAPYITGRSVLYRGEKFFSWVGSTP